MKRIQTHRDADIIGPNSTFVTQLGTFPKKFTDYDPRDSKDKMQRSSELVVQSLERECAVPVTQSSTMMWRALCGLGSHDLSAMREALGTPTKILGAHLGFPFWKWVDPFSVRRFRPLTDLKRSFQIPGIRCKL